MAFTNNSDISQTPGYLQTVLDAVSIPVVIQRPDFTIVFANKAAGKLFPAPNLKEDKVAVFCHKILFNLDRPCSEHGLPCPVDAVLAQKEEVTVLRTIQAVDGQERWLEIQGQPIFDKAGEVVQIIETITDITQNKAMSNALVRFNRSQEEFFHASRKISTTSDLKELYRHIICHAKELLQFDFSTLFLFSEDNSALVVHDTVGFPEAIINTFMITDGQGLATYVAKTKKTDTVLDFKTESRFEVPKLIIEHDIRSALCVPMIIADDVLGILVGHSLKLRTFTDQEITLYENLANQAAMTLHSAQTLKELRASDERYHDLFENSLDMIQMIGQDGRILYVNKAWKMALGYSDNEIPHLSVFDIIHPNHRSHCHELFTQLCQGEKVALMETIFQAKDGRSFPVEGHINSNIQDGKLISTRGIFRDVTDRKVFEDKLHELSITDELTGLLNRRGFFIMAEKQLAISTRTGNNLYLLYADLDNMKLINDRKGHKIGDQALIETTRLLRDTFRDGDIIARVGGDEFAVLLTAIDKNQDEQSLLNRFDKNMALLNKQKNRHYELRISTGIAKYERKANCSLEDLMSRADNLMYENKRNRRKLKPTAS